ncbi:MAG: deoxyguanosinetriphosphate triphosphohydrolase [Candidatus Abyssobacteria bacterium SURF_5]|uniref:Deoxyguanosinetriphosphate triphosphohydrolase-like protein n=1 Tax=Abyssobacteria bacterium (strain SURF_5) TaxID=2093360 RepID=A0A3A4NX47_ABYX5|nr:MAG: deoxyguanosinetriphosphate triphosphohydrolase [Candidatus Abyssubacteria bacterium SURF_5]
MIIRKMLEKREHEYLSQRASFSDESRGRARPIDECPYRTSYQRDRDRIIHSKSFRRLKHKTQVFLSPTGDHFRTRLTHTLEVAQIARTISRALCLNEDLTEAIALGHDLGHTPFGHAGETVLNELHSGGFSHNEQSLRIVEKLENGKGLNLTFEVRDGILNHSKGPIDIFEGANGEGPTTLEGQVVRISDGIAYINHDIDDAIRSGLIGNHDLPPECVRVLGNTSSSRIDRMVADVILNSQEACIQMSPDILRATNRLRAYLFQNLYPRPEIQDPINRTKRILKEIFYLLIENPNIFLNEIKIAEPEEPLERLAVDFIAGMTDRYALDFYRSHFLPQFGV